jgi:hypothetical protein
VCIDASSKSLFTEITADEQQRLISQRILGFSGFQGAHATAVAFGRLRQLQKR